MLQPNSSCTSLQLIVTVLLAAFIGAQGADEVRAPGTVTLHTVVPTECTMYFSWQSLGIQYSHRKAGQVGPITRIISCTEEQKQTYKDVDLMPSHIVPSLTNDAEHNDVYSAYNKPGAVMYWLRDVEPTEDFILVIDADMIMRQPFDPIALQAGPGWAISAFFTYMKGVNNELALRHVPQVKPRTDNLAGPPGRRGDQVGGFTLMHTKDLERVAPLWLSFTTAVRNDPTAWNTTGDSYSIHPGDKPWISEMYGYSYACAAADVWHKVDFTAMLYPAYFSATPPKVLHYGLIYTIANTNYTFDKHWHYDFDATACPPWDLTTDRPKKGLFPHPPRASSFTTKGEELLRDLLAIQVIVELNAAFCERHLVKCPSSDQLLKECTYVKEMEDELDAAFVDVEYQISIDSCKDHDTRCKMWADVGECDNNPGFMTNNCKVACKKCTLPKTAPTKKVKSSLPASSNLLQKAAMTVQEGAVNASDAAGKLLSAGKEAAGSLVTNATALKDSLPGGSTVNRTGDSVLTRATDRAVAFAVAKAANSSRRDGADDAPRTVKNYDFAKEADTKVDAALKAQAAAEQLNLAADAQAKAEPRLIQADPADPDEVEEDLSHPLLNGQTRQEAKGVTQDLHEADLDLSHTDKAPERQDSIEADSIIKSVKRADPTSSSGNSASATGKAQLAASGAANAVTSQGNAVAGSLDHVKENVVTDAKITDPEQEFKQGNDDGGKQPGSRSQKLELGKSQIGSLAGKGATAVTRPAGGKTRFTRRVITLGFFLWVLAVIGFLAILRLPRAQSLRRKPLIRRKSQTARLL